MVKPLTHDNEDGQGLLIGDDPDTGRPLYYCEEGCLMTIAPPGRGKTQCHILPNLLDYKGPAVVLDVKGELWNLTSRQRAKYGPVYRLDPRRPALSDHYNAFDFVSADLNQLWTDAETLAKLLHVPQAGDGGGHFYDTAAFAYQAAIIAYIKAEEPPHRQNPSTLRRYVSGLSLDDFLTKAAAVKKLPALQEAVATIRNSDSRTKGNVIWFAQNDLGSWADPVTADLCRVSDWNPASIRADNATVYICISAEMLRNQPGLARVVIGQHIHALTRDEIRHQDRLTTPWVQFFVDEAPQLRHMDVLTLAIETARSYNVRLWLVGQWLGQFVTAFGKDTAEGMMGVCGLQAYLSPALKDGTAAAVSDQIGHFEHPYDGSGRRPLVTPQALAGPDYADYVVAFDQGQFRKLRKHPFHEDARLKKMAGPLD